MQKYNMRILVAKLCVYMHIAKLWQKKIYH
jgi:hypothetical protein